MINFFGNLYSTKSNHFNFFITNVYSFQESESLLDITTDKIINLRNFLLTTLLIYGVQYEGSLTTKTTCPICFVDADN